MIFSKSTSGKSKGGGGFAKLTLSTLPTSSPSYIQINKGQRENE